MLFFTLYLLITSRKMVFSSRLCGVIDTSGGSWGVMDQAAPTPLIGYDVVVIGAGVNGAGIARDAALRGYRVCLLDASDIGSGTSAASSRLIHGGIRYLEHGELRLVRESLRERELLLRNAPHLVEPFGLLIPFYRHNGRTPMTLRAGMLAYDLLSADKTTPWHRLIGRASKPRWPGLAEEGWQGGALYYDAQARFAERIAVEIALSAAEAGATVLTYTPVIGFTRSGNQVTGVRVRQPGRAEAEIGGRVVINAAGPWVDLVLGTDGIGPRLIGGTKGSHVVVDPFPGAPSTGVHYEAKSDGRAVLVLPWGGRYLIGSTDLYHEGDPGEVVCTDEEVDYLLGETNALIPGAGLVPDDVLFSYSGVRPLPYTPAAGNEANVSRDHAFVSHGPGHQGLISITGGKLTTWRSLAEQGVDLISRRLGGKRRCVTRQLPLPGARCADWPAFAEQLRLRSPYSARTTEHLLAVYGVRATEVLALAADDHRLAKVLPGEDEPLAAEFVFAFGNELARTLTDALARRTMVGLDGAAGLDTALAAAEVCGEVLGWSDERIAQEIEAYHRFAQRLRPRALRNG
jgi:glycerol-3-phosphate dehydrogenase